MKSRKVAARAGAVVLVLVGVLAGSVIGPAMGNAAGKSGSDPATTVEIQGTGSSTKAKVSSTGRLKIDSEANVTVIGGSYYLDTYGVAFTQPTGEFVIATTGDSTLAPCGLITGVVVDGSSGSKDSTVTLTSGGHVIWAGTVPKGGGHIGDTFENGVFFPSPVTISSSGSPTWAIYGELFSGCASGNPHALKTAKAVPGKN
jgi:hypothetical protein